MNRLNHQEIAEIARLVARRGMRAQGMGPTSGEVGAVLGVSSSEVEAMLHEMRLKNDGMPLANPGIERRTVLLSVGSVVALLIFAALALLRGSLSGSGSPAPVASVPTTSASSAVPTTTYPLEPPATAARSTAPVAKSAPPLPSGLAPQIAPSGEARVVTSGTQLRQAIDAAAPPPGREASVSMPSPTER